MIETIKERLTSLGYECVESDAFALQFCIDKVTQYIKHFCNISEIPACLEAVQVDMVCGEFLLAKKSMGQLTSIQIDGVVKRLTEGDTTVEYAVTTDREATFNAYLDKMAHGHDSDLIAHRKLRW